MANIPLSLHPGIPDFSNASESLFQRTGKLRFTMRNDYLFKMVLQADMDVLAHLTAALLHMPFEDIKEISVQNPIIPGKTINDKTFILDVRILLNRKKSINLEMQVCDQQNWKERSTGIICDLSNAESQESSCIQ